MSVIVFLIVHITPGDPAMLMMGPQGTMEQLHQIREKLGLNDSILVQYTKWLGNVMRGDMGNSIWLARPVLNEVLTKFKATLILAGAALFISTTVGLTAGIIAGTKPNSKFDRISMVFALFGISIPNFWLSIMLIIIFAVEVPRWIGCCGLPPAGMYSPLGGGDLKDLLKHLILPAISLSALNIAYVARLTRSSMLEIISLDYIRTARAKGLGERGVILNHALKNALIPVVTVLGIQLAFLLSGAIIVEYIFSWPGLGNMMLSAIGSRDYPLVQGAALFIAVAFTVCNLLVDISYSYLDPRIRYG